MNNIEVFIKSLFQVAIDGTLGIEGDSSAPVESAGVLKTSSRQYSVRVITDGISAGWAKLVQMVKDLWNSLFSSVRADEAPVVIENKAEKPIEPTSSSETKYDMSSKELIQASFMNFSSELMNKIVGARPSALSEDGSFEIEFPHEMTGILKKIIPLTRFNKKKTDPNKYRLLNFVAEGATFRVSKKLRGKINFDDGKVTLEEPGIVGKRFWKTFAIKEFHISGDSEFTFYKDTSDERRVTKDQISDGLSAIEWNQDKDKLLSIDSEPYSGQSTSEELQFQLEGEFSQVENPTPPTMIVDADQPKIEVTSPSLWNRAVSLVYSNRDLLVSASETTATAVAASAGAYLLGLVF
ncbi:MAG: hypothetical protein JSS30_04680 [Verrucomicrobia bacterium]|nr:hypothetical protein [Verrucomicrobiota bacterium]